MSNQKSSYRQIMKATSIFGGVQVIQIIVQIIRSKIVAVLIETAGMCINSLLNSTIQLLSDLTNFGLKTSAVKNIAATNGTGDNKSIAQIVTVLRHWVCVTGLLGTLLTLILSPWLSELTFGNREYKFAFLWISIRIDVNSLLLSKYFELKKENVVVGNGAAELIKSLMQIINGSIGIIFPTFEEYPNRISNEKIVPYYLSNSNYSYDVNDLIIFFNDKEINSLLIINPDNPSGNFLVKENMLTLAKWAKSKNIILIVDESFIDFVDLQISGSLMTQEILNDFHNLIVIKSISKSFGLPGLRLGLLASYNQSLISAIKKDVAIWNINSFAEFFLQIFERYKTDYDNAIIEFHNVRNKFFNELSIVKNLHVIPSQANYILCQLTGGHKATFVTQKLLNKHNLLVKDLSKKVGINGEYIRVAVKKPEENIRLIQALMILLK